MAGQSQELPGGLTVSEILKSAFEITEKVLVSREDKLKEEIKEKQKKNEQLQRQVQFLESEKFRLEKECIQFKDFACRLREDDQREIVEFKRKICELECEKLRVRTDLNIVLRSYNDLEFRVLSLEKSDFNNGKTKAVLQTNTYPSDGSSYGERTEATVGTVESDDDMGFGLRSLFN